MLRLAAPVARAVLAAGAVLAGPAPIAPGPDDLAADERAILFPTDAHPVEGGWSVRLHAWIFEPELDSLWRRAALRGLADALDLDEDAAEHALFRTRAAPLIADSESGKTLVVQGPDTSWILPESGANGHASLDVFLPAAHAPAPGPDGGAPRVLVVRSAPSADNPHLAAGHVQLVPARGVSVVSDVDDTIKVSEVLDHARLLERTFLEPFEPVDGMALAYAAWAAHGAAFHYVSASPWGLYEALDAFVVEHGFPRGSVHLRHARLKDGSALDLLAASDAYKLARVLELLDRWPQRRFVLVGDAGERDPEVYGEAARARPEQVAVILIRRLQGADLSDARWTAAFAGVPAARWRLFDDGHDLREIAWPGEDG